MADSMVEGTAAQWAAWRAIHWVDSSAEWWADKRVGCSVERSVGLMAAM